MGRRLRLLIALGAVVLTVVAVSQPLYAHVEPLDLKGVGFPEAHHVLKDYFITKHAPPAGHRWLSILVKIALLAAAAAVVVGAVATGAPAWLIRGGAGAALLMAAGLSIYVLMADDALWWDGLSWLCAAAVALGLVAFASRSASSARPAAD
jgi:hypothetical protein